MSPVSGRPPPVSSNRSLLSLWRGKCFRPARGSQDIEVVETSFCLLENAHGN